LFGGGLSMARRLERNTFGNHPPYRTLDLMRPFRDLLFLSLVGAAGCAAPHTGDTLSVSPAAAQGGSPSVWAVDLVRTLPGRQADYLRGIAANWGGARALARQRGAVRSYRALAAAPDTSRGWDVLLITEYADSAAFAEREVTFSAIFADPRYVAGRVLGAPSAELREFVAGEVVMRSVAGEGAP
jgi:hypothetical protein